MYFSFPVKANLLLSIIYTKLALGPKESIDQGLITEDF